VEVSPKEFTILQMLLENRGQIQSRTRLEQGLYAWGHEVDSNVVEVHIHHLRKKLGDGLIRTVRGVGYIIDSVDG
jgi:DNA-binding response OmpR family regulator